LFLSYLQPFLLSKEKDIDKNLQLFRGLFKTLAFNIVFKLYTNFKQTLLNFLYKNNNPRVLGNPNVALLTTVLANSSLEAMSGFDCLIKQEEEEDNENDKTEKERVERERKERAERERIEREERERIEREEKERIEQEERREYLERARLEIEHLEQHRERLERDRIDKEKQEREKSEHQHQEEVKEPTENKFKEIWNLNKLDRRDPKPNYSKESLQTRRSKENKIHEETPIPPSRISSKLDSKTSNIASRIKQRREIIEIIEKGKQLK
jgi:hypothetical protein